MLFPLLSIVSLVYIIRANSLYESRVYFFTMTIITSVFFFSSGDPIFNIPIYFFFMLISLLLSLIKCKISTFKFPIAFLVLISYLLVQIFVLASGVELPPTILINQSNTDTMDILKELFSPNFNFTVLKHFLFFVLYLFFILFNKDLLVNLQLRKKIISIIYLSFQILFISIIVESLIVNIFDLNDRNLMGFIFNISQNNQLENWKTFGISSVCFCFSERSTMAIIFIFYSILYNRNLEKKEFIWILISLMAVFCTGSSSALVISVLFSVILALKNRKKFLYSKWSFFVFGSVFIVFVFLLIRYNNILFEKIYNYLFTKETWGSAFFRAQSNYYGMMAFFNSYMFGYGIGTVYCHSMLIQTLANIGIFGFCLTIHLHIKLLNKRLTTKYLPLVILFVAISSAAYIIQQFTSPFLLAIIISIFTDSKESN